MPTFWGVYYKEFFKSNSLCNVIKDFKGLLFSKSVTLIPKVLNHVKVKLYIFITRLLCGNAKLKVEADRSFLDREEC
jgi:hypothetical protein